MNGIHFYININNLSNVVRKDEIKHDDLVRTFHQLQTFLSCLEEFANELEYVTIEKITFSRIHFFTKVINDKSIDEIFKSVYFAFKLGEYMKTHISKYQLLPQFTIGTGADSGNFTIFEYSEGDIKEITSIGSPANRAAKIQSLCDDNKMLISRDLFYHLTNEKKEIFTKAINESIELSFKYEGLEVYETKISSLIGVIGDERFKNRIQTLLIHSQEIANRINFSNIELTDAYKQIDFSNLSLVQSKNIQNSLILYADIRGFTNKVDNYQLDYIKGFVQIVLKSMYKAVESEKGTHVKFQGDRESAVFNADKDKDNYIERGIFAALRMIDSVNEINLSGKYEKFNLGIGCDMGEVYATRIGMRGEKYNVILGKTERNADYIEDSLAGSSSTGEKTEVVISDQLYQTLKKINPVLSNLFNKQKARNYTYWSCVKGLKNYQGKQHKNMMVSNASNAISNNLKPWGAIDK